VLAKVDGDDYHTEWVDQLNNSGNTNVLVNGNVTVTLDSDGSLYLPTGGAIWLNYGYIDQDTDQDGNALRVSGGNCVVINTSEDGQQWLFDAVGNITLPTNLYFSASPAVQSTGIVFGDGTLQTTAFTGITFSDIVTASETAPNTDTLWFNTEEARVYVKYNEQWVDASPTVLAPPDTNPTLESVTFNDATVQTTAWTGTVSYNDLTDKPVTPAFVGGGGAGTWLTPN
jgi:hypothetical protein